MSKTKTAEEWLDAIFIADPGLPRRQIIDQLITSTRADERQKALSEAAKIAEAKQYKTVSDKRFIQGGFVIGCKAVGNDILALRDAKGKE